MKKKPNRQISDRAKISKTFRLDADLVDWLETRSRSTVQSQVDIVETALNEYKETSMSTQILNRLQKPSYASGLDGLPEKVFCLLNRQIKNWETRNFTTFIPEHSDLIYPLDHETLIHLHKLRDESAPIRAKDLKTLLDLLPTITPETWESLAKYHLDKLSDTWDRRDKQSLWRVIDRVVVYDLIKQHGLFQDPLSKAGAKPIIW